MLLEKFNFETVKTGNEVKINDFDNFYFNNNHKSVQDQSLVPDYVNSFYEGWLGHVNGSSHLYLDKKQQPVLVLCAYIGLDEWDEQNLRVYLKGTELVEKALNLTMHTLSFNLHNWWVNLDEEEPDFKQVGKLWEKELQDLFGPSVTVGLFENFYQ